MGKLFEKLTDRFIFWSDTCRELERAFSTEICMVTLPSLVIFCSQLIKRCIECIEIYAVDSVIQLLSHWSLVDSFRSENSGPEQSMVIDNNRWQSLSINRLILIIDGQSIKKIFVNMIIIDYQYQSIIDGNRSIKIVTPKRTWQICNLSSQFKGSSTQIPAQSTLQRREFVSRLVTGSDLISSSS